MVFKLGKRAIVIISLVLCTTSTYAQKDSMLTPAKPSPFLALEMEKKQAMDLLNAVT